MLRALLVFASLAAAPALAAAPSPISIRGSVLGDEGRAVAGASAELMPVPSPLERRRLDSEGAALPAAIASARTGASGLFTLTAPGPGLYYVIVRSPGSVPSASFVPAVEEKELPPLRLIADAGLTVRVVDAAGRPLPGARVRLSAPIRGGRDGGWWVAPRLGLTDSDGRVRLSRPADEEGTVDVHAVGHAEVETRAPEGKTTFEVRLERGCPRTVEVREGNRPATEVWLDAAGWPVGKSDAAGRFTWAASCRAETRVTALSRDGRLLARATLRPVATGAKGRPAPVAPIVRLALSPETPLTGRVIESETRRPLPDALVWLSSLGNFAVTDARGVYALPRDPDAQVAARPQLAAVAAGYFLGWGWGNAGPGVAAPTLALRPAATIEGKVIDGDGKAVAGAELVAMPERPDPFSRGSFPGSARTRSGDPGGAFRLRVEPGSPLQLRTEAEGFAPATLRLDALAPHATREQVRVVLSLGRRATGVVTDGSGAPLAGARVELTEAPSSDRSSFSPWGGSRPRQAVTGADGAFALSGLPGGRYDLSAQAPGFATTRVRGLTLPEDTGQTDLGTVILQPGIRVSGLVSDSAGRPIPGAKVKRWPDSGANSYRRPAFILATLPAEQEVSTDGEGRFTLDGLSSGTAVEIGAAATGFVSSPPLRVTVPSEEAVRLVLAPAAKVSGRVVDDRGEPVSAQVTATPVAERTLGAMDDFPTARATTDGEGRFTLDGLTAGRMEIEAMASGYLSPPTQTLDLVAGREVGDVELVVAGGATIEGQVLAPDGAPVDGARVSMQRQEQGAQFSFRGARLPSATTDGDGRFQMTGIPPGPRSLAAEREGYLRGVKDVEARAGETAHVELRLGEGRVLTGRVVDGAGLPVEGAAVRIQSSDYRSRGATSAADGSFRFTGLQPGRLQLSATLKGKGSARLDELTVTDASPPPVELRLVRGGTLSGRLLGLTFPEIAQVQVSAGRERDWRQAAEIDFEGRYRFEDLTEGEWWVSARLESNGRSAKGKVQIPGAGAEATLDLEFGTGLALGGRVLFGGEPLAGASIWARGAPGEGGEGVSDTQGRFRIEGLKPGSFKLMVSHFERGVNHEEPAPVELATSRDDLSIDIPAHVRVRGRVIEAGSQEPVAGAEIAFEWKGEPGGFRPVWDGQAGRSDARGTWSVSAPAGTYRVTARKADYAPGDAQLQLTAGSEPPEVRLTLSPAAGLVVEVQGPGGLLPAEIDAALVDAGGQVVVAGSYAPGEDGRIRISQAPSGSFTLLLKPRGLATVSAAVIVPGANSPVALLPATRLTVTVPALAEDSEGALLTLTGADGRRFRSLAWRGHILEERNVGHEGRAEIDDLPPGSYTVEVTAPGGRSWRGTAVAAGGTASVRLE